MRKTLRKLRLPLIIITIAILTTGWIYRARINKILCGIAVSYIESKTGTSITYSDIEASLTDMTARDVEITGNGCTVEIKTLKLNYDKAILYREHKLAWLKKADVNNFLITIEDKAGIKDDSNKAQLGSRRKLITDLLARFNAQVNLKNGRILFTAGNIRQEIDIRLASLTNDHSNGSLIFELNTGSRGLIPESSVTGVFEPALPGYFNARASLNTYFFGNHWNWHDVKLETGWSLDGSFSLALDAHAGQEAGLTIGYETNIFEESISKLDISAKNIKLTDHPGINELYLNGGILSIVDERMAEVFTENKIAGTFDTRVSVLMMPEQSEPDVSVKINITDGELLYHRFPYKLETIAGDVNIDGNRFSADLKTSEPDEISIKASAVTDDSQGSRHGLDVRIESPSLSIDQKLYNALGQVSKMTWLSFAPEGRVKIDYHLFDNKNDRLEYKLDMYPLSASVCYKEFPYQINDLEGKITLRPGSVELHEIIGRSGIETITAGGRIDNLREEPEVNLNFQCTNIQIDEALIDLLPDQFRSKLEQFEFNGTFADMKVNVGSDNTGKLDYDVQIDANASAVTYLTRNVTFEGAYMKARFLDGTFNIESFHAAINGQPVSLNGQASIRNKENLNFSFEFDSGAKNFERLISGLNLDIENDTRLSGPVTVKGSIQGGEQITDYSLSLNCKNAVLTLDQSRLENFNGNINIDKDAIEYDVAGSLEACENCDIISSGTFEAAAPFDGVLSLSITGIKPTDPIIPNDFPVTGAGSIDISMPQAVIEDGILDCPNTVLSFTNLDYKGESIKNATGDITCRVIYDNNDDRLEVPDGQINIESVEAYDRLVEEVHSGFIFSPTKGLKVSNTLTAKSCGGSISGFISYMPSKGEGNYEITLDLYDLDADKLLNSGSEDVLKKQFDLDGRISGQVYLKGIPGDDSSRVGRFSFDVQNVMVSDKTLFDKVLDTILSFKDMHKIQNISVDSYMRANTIFVDDVAISLPLMLLRGGGEINIETGQIKMQLNAQGTKTIDNGFFSKLSFLKAIGKTIANVKITGDIADPKIETTALGFIKN